MKDGDINSLHETGAKQDTAPQPRVFQIYEDLIAPEIDWMSQEQERGFTIDDRPLTLHSNTIAGEAPKDPSDQIIDPETS